MYQRRYRDHLRRMKTEVQSDVKGFGGKANKNRALHASYIDVNSIKNSNTEYFLQTAISNNPSTTNINQNRAKIWTKNPYEILKSYK